MLGERGVLERFLGDGEAAMVRATLVGQWDASDAGAAARAAQAPGAFVLKAQREGGGNNVSQEDMRRVLQKVPAEKRAAFTLMERIYPGAQANVMVEAGGWTEVEVQSELGMFGSVIAVDGVIVENCAVGHGLKSKPTGTDEGGVQCGRGGYGSIILTV